MPAPIDIARFEPSPGHGDIEALHLRARLLPGGSETDLWIVDGRITREPVEGARTLVSGGWMMPSLVDSHLHLGVPEIGGPLNLDALKGELGQLAASGIGAVRVLGGPSPIPPELLERPGQQLVQQAGVPLAAPDRFIPGWGRRVTDRELEFACADRTSTPWVKIIADWFDEDGGYSASFAEASLRRAVEAAHDAGRRVAVHTQSADGGASAVRAGADSIEHGMHLPEDLVDELAKRGGILVPTGAVFERLAPSMQDDAVPQELQLWYREGLAAHAELARRAADAGVTVLAGTDLPVGHLVDEIEWLIGTGLPVERAIGAASWTAREVLGFPCLREGERADLLWTQTDPREEVGTLRDPDLVVLDGSVITPGAAA